MTDGADCAVWKAEGLRWPTYAEVEQTWQQGKACARIGYIKGLTRREWIQLGVYGVQGYGFFKVGEVVGRRHLVGYNV
ncbi:hypothetical protein PORY_000507 [Pneumocystis oryctolagi]|uniref:Uncharacterized protein n=1 Tax=Pneumocystis oryctolagi TaxID=42067 RepID=A0ACB7CFH2_9ASCO|nr:hypothetical protein PORY_000507 [Pneumocystis oryctolagi]